jgi:hypothetical protein
MSTEILMETMPKIISKLPTIFDNQYIKVGYKSAATQGFRQKLTSKKSLMMLSLNISSKKSRKTRNGNLRGFIPTKESPVQVSNAETVSTK